MPQAIVIRQYGGPEVLVPEDLQTGPPGPGQVRLRHVRIGVNFHDIYVRSGLYKTLALPGTPGIEATGVITDVGAGVNGWQAGDRVCYVTGAYGVYAAERLIDADRLIRLPDALSDTLVASTLLRGLTADMLLNTVGRVRPDATLLIQAAAGGMGQLLTQWARHLGATTIGTVRTAEQADLARANGCQHIIRYRDEDVVSRVHELTGGRGVDVAFDGVGGATLAGSFASLAPCSHLVNFGQVAGPVPPIEMSALAARSTTVSRPIVFHYVQNPATRDAMAQRLFEALGQGWLSVSDPREFALADAADAHRTLEAAGASQPLLLVPEGA